MQTMQHQILRRIERFNPGKAFSAKDFLDIASRTEGSLAEKRNHHESGRELVRSRNARFIEEQKDCWN